MNSSFPFNSSGHRLFAAAFLLFAVCCFSCCNNDGNIVPENFVQGYFFSAPGGDQIALVNLENIARDPFVNDNSVLMMFIYSPDADPVHCSCNEEYFDLKSEPDKTCYPAYSEDSSAHCIRGLGYSNDVFRVGDPFKDPQKFDKTRQQTTMIAIESNSSGEPLFYFGDPTTFPDPLSRPQQEDKRYKVYFVMLYDYNDYQVNSGGEVLFYDRISEPIYFRIKLRKDFPNDSDGNYYEIENYSDWKRPDYSNQ